MKNSIKVMKSYLKITNTINAHWKTRRFTAGMTWKEIIKLLDSLVVGRRSFCKALGTNTCVVDLESYETLYYYVDVERTLAKILKYRVVSLEEED